VAFRKIDEIRLKDGSPAERVVVTPPAPDWLGRIGPFANDPPQVEGPNRTESFLLADDLQGLAVHFYLVMREGEILGLMLVTDACEMGYICSTFVTREFRRLGVMTAIMEVQEAEFAERGGRIRLLSTRNGSPAFAMFEKWGYRGIEVAPGDERARMIKFYGNSSWESFFGTDGTDLAVEDARWGHSEGYRALSACPTADFRPARGRPGMHSYQCYAQSPVFQWKCLVDAEGRLYGDAILWPYRDFNIASCHPADEYVVDLAIHAEFAQYRHLLFKAIEFPRGRTRAFVDAGLEPDKCRFLVECGFEEEESVLEAYHHHGTRTEDIRIYSRRQD